MSHAPECQADSSREKRLKTPSYAEMVLDSLPRAPVYCSMKHAVPPPLRHLGLTKMAQSEEVASARHSDKGWTDTRRYKSYI